MGLEYVDSAEYSHLRRRNLKRIAALRKRAAHLSQRIAGSQKRLTYDEVELDALLWVLSFVADAEAKQRG